MASNVIRATLLADASKFKSGFKDAEKATETFGSKASGLAKGLTAGLGVAAAAAVVSFAKQSIDAFSKLEQATGSVESVFGESADKIIGKSQTAASEFGLSMTEFQSSAALLGSQLKNVLGLSAEEAAGQVDDLIGKAADMAATFGGTTSDAVSAIGSLMRGERDPIEKYGVSMNEASIQAKALELGLADATGEISDQAKKTATLAILNEQTADSAGQFARETDSLAGSQQIANAKMENAKALLGQALSPALAGATDLTGKFADILGDLALNMLVARGEISEGEAAVHKWNSETGIAIQSTDDLATALDNMGVNTERIAGGKGGFIDAASSAKEFHDEVLNGLEATGASIELAKEWRSEIKAVGDAHGWEKDQTNAAADAIDQYIKWQEAAERPISDNERALYGLENQTEDTADATDDLREAQEHWVDQAKGMIDPVYALRNAQKDLKTAQDNVRIAMEKFGEGSPEHLDALSDQHTAWLDLKGAENEVAIESGVTRTTYERNLRASRQFTETEIGIMMAEFDSVNAYRFADKTIHIRRTGYDPRHPGQGGPQEFQTGGVVPGSGPQLAIVHGGETILPTKPGQKPTVAAGTVGAQSVVNIYVQSLDPKGAAKAVVQAIETYKRNNGGRLPF